jgi:hypothetical protein
MSLLEERCPFEEPLSPIGRVQLGLAAFFMTTSPKNGDGDGDRFVDDKLFINKRKLLSATVEKSNCEHTLI